MTSLAALSVDELADGICLRAGRIAAAQAELLRWVAEFDRREGWAGPGMLSCAHLLSWRIGLSLGTARDQVRVARRLEDLPQLAAAFADGRVSYSKVRAITRVAQPDDGIDWIELARSSSAAQLDTLVRGVARARAHARTTGRSWMRSPRDGRPAPPADRSWQPPTTSPGCTVSWAPSRCTTHHPVLCPPCAGRPRHDRPRSRPPRPPRPRPPEPATTRASRPTPKRCWPWPRTRCTPNPTRPDLRRRRSQLTARLDPLSGWARQPDGELLPPFSLTAVLKTLPGHGGVLRLRHLTPTDLRRRDLGRDQ